MSEVLEKINELPEDWAEAQLSDLSERITKGSTPTSYGYAYKTEGIKFIKAENIDATGHATTTSNYIDDETHDFLSRSQLKENDLLFSIAGTIGRVGIVRDIDLPANTNQALAIIRLSDKAIDIKYLYYYLNSPQIQNVALNKIVGVGRANLSLTNISEFRVPLPPPEQQKRIVAKIEVLSSHIDAGIAALKKAKQLLKNYRQSVLKAAVTGELTKEWRGATTDKLEPATQLLERILEERRQKWEEQQLQQFKAKGKIPKDDKWKEKYKVPLNASDELEIPTSWVCASFDALVIDSQNGISKRRGKEGVETHVLRLADITNGEIDESSARDIVLTDAERQKYLLINNDLLCIRVNGSKDLVGRMIRVDVNDDWGFCDHFIRFRLPVDSVDISFMDLIFDSKYARDFVGDNMVSSAGQNTVSQSTMARMTIPLPPFEEQKEIMGLVYAKFEAIKRLDTELDLHLAKVEKNKQSILASAFSGKLARVMI